jgi:hypothetical protein
VSEVPARLIEVRSAGHSGLDLLTLSCSHSDPKPPLTKERSVSAPPSDSDLVSFRDEKRVVHAAIKRYSKFLYAEQEFGVNHR